MAHSEVMINIWAATDQSLDRLKICVFGNNVYLKKQNSQNTIVLFLLHPAPPARTGDCPSSCSHHTTKNPKTIPPPSRRSFYSRIENSIPNATGIKS